MKRYKLPLESEYFYRAPQTVDNSKASIEILFKDFSKISLQAKIAEPTYYC
jgi:hypothetical protein